MKSDKEQVKNFEKILPDKSIQYPSCDWIEGGLVFKEDCITACCVSFEGGGQPKLADYRNAGELPVEEIIQSRNQIIYDNQNGGHAACRNCSRLESKIWEERSYIFDKILFNHFNVCNVSCIYCFEIKRKIIPADKVPMLLPIIKELIDNRQLMSGSNIYFGGGEPTILPEFEDLYSLLTSHGSRFTIFSNAVKFSKAIEESLQADLVDTLLISPDAATNSVFKMIKRVDKCDQVWKNITRYIKASPEKTWPKIIFMSENVCEAVPFMERAEKSGATHVVYDVEVSMEEVSESIIQAAAAIILEGKKRGITTIRGEAGINYRPNAKIPDRIDQCVETILAGEE